MNKRIILTIGIPASGKSTWAKEEVLNGGAGIVRINKDDLRSMVHNNKFSKDREKQILGVRDSLIGSFLIDPKIYTIIVDDTNLHPKHFEQISRIAEDYSKALKIHISVVRKWFHDSFDVELCHKRNTSRERSVPYTVIENMYEQYVRLDHETHGGTWPIINPNGVPAIICDIDGTLADHKGIRSPFDWDKVDEDRPKKMVIDVLRNFAHKNYTIILLSGRDGSCQDKTKKWLGLNGVPYDELHMRAPNDNRKDWLIKRELYTTYVLPKYRVDLVLDDRDQVVRQWRALGVECWQVAAGRF